jgi:hypothetical protein
VVDADLRRDVTGMPVADEDPSNPDTVTTAHDFLPPWE